MSVSDTAELLGVSRSQVLWMVKEKAISSVRLGRQVFVPRASLEGWMEAINEQGLA